jgi:uncharacterized membrane protein SpoIIM required for sporulation
MRETQFIEQKKAEWQALERELLTQSSDPDRLSDLFIQATDDLSYARTFYPNRSVRVYLNGLAQSLFLRIYQNKRLSLDGIFQFFREELPDMMWEARCALFWATTLFILLFIVGWVSAAYNPGFDKTILGEEYIRMTKENIAKGNPMGVYQDGNTIDMFFRIGINNIKVDFVTFVLGIFAGIGSIMVMISNAVMVGVFQHFFWAYGGFKDSLFSIWVHGAFEISAIILSTVAGMEMGRGLIFPGTYSRLQAFQVSARRGIKIFIGVLCITVIAAFNESFLTRYSHAPYILRGTLIFFSFAFIFFYFVYYPYSRHKAGLTKPEAQTKLTADGADRIAWQSIKGTAEVLNDTFVLLLRQIGSVLALAGLSGVGYALALYLFVGGDLKSSVVFRNWIPPLFYLHFQNIFQFLDYQKNTIFFAFANCLVLAIASLVSNFWLLQAYLRSTAPKAAPITFIQFLKTYKGQVMSAAFVAAILTAVLFLPVGGFFAFFVLLPTLQMWQFVQLTQNSNGLSAIGDTLRLFQRGFLQVFVLYALLLGFAAMITLITSSSLWLHLIDFVQWNLVITEAQGYAIMRYVLAGTTLFSFAFFAIMFKFAFGLLAASLYEQENANSLFAQIENLGSHASLRGMAKE